jgi:hypothetical protein
MNQRDYIGKRGETIFAFLIGKKCSGRFWFHCDFLGDKAEAKDFIVYLINPTRPEATFFVQVKATSQGYSGKGRSRKLKVNVGKKDVKKLKGVTGPAYIVGVDVETEEGYLVAITKKSKARYSGISCRHKIDCALIERLWQEVDDYWAKRDMTATKSRFS